ncbi:hypothetical protein AT239_07045 [Bartonella henselae]|nr:hypothetical protein AT240_02280 [Bartonella henselae]OLL54761.1 hypothetical protein AT239_07045 [Bartonella henselae]
MKNIIYPYKSIFYIFDIGREDKIRERMLREEDKHWCFKREKENLVIVENMFKRKIISVANK